MPLTPAALDVLKVLKAGRQRRRRGMCSPGSVARASDEGALDGLTVTNVRPHNLRRTAASLMAGAGVARLVISKVLNHVERGITAVYDRHSYDAEKRDRARHVGAHVESHSRKTLARHRPADAHTRVATPSRKI